MRKVAVIGGGQIFENVHLKAINSVHDVELTAICEPNKKRASELKTLCSNANIYENIDEMLKIEKIDCAIVSVPNKYHYDTTIKLLENKIDVLCEKPPAINAKEALQMHECALKNKVKLYYNFHLRQKKILDKIKLNNDDIYYVDIKATRRRGIPGWGSFIIKDIQGGGALIDLGIHYLDLFLSITKDYDITSIISTTDDYIGKHEDDGDFGKWNKDNFTVENFCSATLKNKYLINLVCSFAHNIAKKDEYELIIYTKDGRIDVLNEKSYNTKNELILSTDDNLDQNELRIKSSMTFLNATYINMCDSKQGYLIQQLIDKIYKNAEE